MSAPRIAILGAGPIGLDAALAAAERGWSVTLYEAGDRPAAHVRDWGHVRLFSPWSIDASPRMRRALSAAGQAVPDDATSCPTGHELCDRLLDPVAALPAVASALRLGTRVVAVGREGLLKHEAIGTGERDGRPFRLLVERAGTTAAASGSSTPTRCSTARGPTPIRTGSATAASRRRGRRLSTTGAIASSGASRTWRPTRTPGPARRSSWSAAATRPRPRRGTWPGWRRRGRTTPGTRVLWALRGAAPPTWRIADDPLPARAALAEEAEALARGRVARDRAAASASRSRASREADGRIEVTLRSASAAATSGDGPGTVAAVTVDRVLALTGSVGDDRIYRQLQVHECYATGAPMKLSAALLGAAAGEGGGGDCMAQTGFGPETLTSPEPRFFILGAKSYGSNSAFLMRTGWEQVDDAFSLLGDWFAPSPRHAGVAFR